MITWAVSRSSRGKPLQIRPFLPKDEAPLRARFSQDGKPPWMRLPSPYTLERLLAPSPQMTVFVAEGRQGEPIGLLAIDESRRRPLVVGPLVPNEQLSELYGRALLDFALAWARLNGISRLQVKVDLGEDRAISFFINQGFRTLEMRQYVLEAHPSKRAPAPVPPGFSFGPCPEMLSSDYMRLYQEIGGPLGWADRSAWTRPQVFEHLQKPGLHLLAVREGDDFVGFAEFEERQALHAELVYFGLLESHRGRGLGGAFLEHALNYGWEQLHWEAIRVSTLTTDAPQALPNYLKRGFRKERAMVFLEKDLETAFEARPNLLAP